ncbi:MAG: acyl-CoA reductase [Daejeonella sp.]
MLKILAPEQRINAFAELGKLLQTPNQDLTNLIENAKQYNAWFTPKNTAQAVKGIAKMLNKGDLEKWIFDNQIQDKCIDFSDLNTQYSIGLILAGNIPMVGFHDIICVLASGNKALIKLSSQDNQLIPYILKLLVEIEPDFQNQIQYIEKLKDFDAVIATGSNNTSRYFEYYFNKVPNIIRKNRNSIAVLNGRETKKQLKALGHDIFDYFGLGCRNVSKLYVPQGYNFNTFFEAIEEFKSIADHHKYNNNYDYNKSIFLVNGDKHLDNGFLLLKQDERLASPLAVLYYEEYADINSIEQMLTDQTGQLQCVATEILLLKSENIVDFGKTQQPELWDYADGVNTMEFLSAL